MDSFLSRFRRLSAWWCVLAILVMLVACPLPAQAFGTGTPSDPFSTSDEAMAACHSYLDVYLNQQQYGYTQPCTLQTGSNSVYGSASPGTGNVSVRYYYSTLSPPSNPCTSLSGVRLYLDGKVSDGFTFSQAATDSSGASVQCAMAATVLGAPVWNQWSQKWQTYANLSPTGNPVDAAGVKDGSGAPVTDVLNPSTYADQAATPSVCDGGSCYNAGSDQYCASAGGSQFCVAGATVRSVDGGCSGSAAVLCGGSPTPPPPPSSKVFDPATQIVGTSHVIQADPVTGAALPVVVNVYSGNASAAPVTSGQTSADSGPAPASSTSPPSSYGGGGDCNSPPVCSGDAVMCGIARQQWTAMCQAKSDASQAHKDLVGDGSSPAISTTHTPADVWTDGTHTGDPLADAANQGNYDSSGLGFATQCPLVDLTVPLWEGREVTVPFAKACVVGQWISAIVLAFAAFAAAKITAGGMS